MHIVAFCARKGGTGKSTLALQLAGDLAARGQQVVLADLDPQGSLQTWAAGRAAGLWPVVTQTDAAHLPALQHTLRERGTGWLLIDTPSVITHPAEAAIAGAELVLIPSQPGAMYSRAVGIPRPAPKSVNSQPGWRHNCEPEAHHGRPDGSH